MQNFLDNITCLLKMQNPTKYLIYTLLTSFRFLVRPNENLRKIVANIQHSGKNRKEKRMLQLNKRLSSVGTKKSHQILLDKARQSVRQAGDEWKQKYSSENGNGNRKNQKRVEENDENPHAQYTLSPIKHQTAAAITITHQIRKVKFFKAFNRKRKKKKRRATAIVRF